MTTWVKFQDFQHQKLKKEILHIRPSGAKYSLNFRYSTDKLSRKVQSNPFKKTESAKCLHEFSRNSHNECFIYFL